MKKVAIGLGIILLVAALAVPVFGRGPGWGHGWGQGSCIGQNYDMRYGRGMTGSGPHDLNLTDEQTAKFQSLREAHQKEVAPLRADLFAKKTELRALWAQTTPDKAAILAKQKEISKLHDQIREKMTNHRFEMREILTPEQQAQLPSFWHGRGMGPRGGFGYDACNRYRAGRGFGPGPCYDGGYGSRR